MYFCHPATHGSCRTPHIVVESGSRSIRKIRHNSKQWAGAAATVRAEIELAAKSKAAYAVAVLKLFNDFEAWCDAENRRIAKSVKRMSVDRVRAIVSECYELDIFRGARRIPVRVRIVAGGKSCSGAVSLMGYMTLTVGASCTVTQVKQLAIHELCHVIRPKDNHTRPFVLALFRAYKEAFGVDVKPDWTIKAGEYRHKAYAMEDLQLKAAVAASAK
jgi:hypothetical protein